MLMDITLHVLIFVGHLEFHSMILATYQPVLHGSHLGSIEIFTVRNHIIILCKHLGSLIL